MAMRSSRRKEHSSSMKKVRKLRRASRRPARKTARKVARGIAKKRTLHKARRVVRTARPKIRARKERARTARRAERPQARLRVMPEMRIEKQERISSLQVSPNLLVTFDPNKLASSKAEVERLLRDVGEEGTIMETSIPGIFKVHVRDAKSTVRKLLEICRTSPERFVRTFHWTPIDRWCATDISEIKSIIKELAQNIGDNERWKMALEKRQFEKHERDLVMELTSVVDKQNVDLHNPDKIIKVDILGNETGLALLSKDEYLNVSSFKG